MAAEPRDGVFGGHRENVGDVASGTLFVGELKFHFQRFVAVARAVAVGALDDDVAQELHFDAFHPGAFAGGATSRAVVEAEPRSVVPAVAGRHGVGKKFADVFKRPDVKRGGGTRGAADFRLINEVDACNGVCAFNRIDECFFGDGLSAVTHEPGDDRIGNERGFTGTGNAGNGRHHADGNAGGEVLKVMRVSVFNREPLRF